MSSARGKKNRGGQVFHDNSNEMPNPNLHDSVAISSVDTGLKMVTRIHDFMLHPTGGDSHMKVTGMFAVSFRV